MELGKLKEWKKTGALKGGFIPMNVAPTVVDFEGHRGVKFEVDRAKYADPEFQGAFPTEMQNEQFGRVTGTISVRARPKGAPGDSLRVQTDGITGRLDE